MLRGYGLTTRAQEFDVTEDIVPDCEDAGEPGSVCVPKKTKPVDKEEQTKFNNRRLIENCSVKPKRRMKQQTNNTEVTMTLDPYAEEARQRRLQEKIRELASQ